MRIRWPKWFTFRTFDASLTENVELIPPNIGECAIDNWASGMREERHRRKREDSGRRRSDRNPCVENGVNKRSLSLSDDQFVSQLCYSKITSRARWTVTHFNSYLQRSLPRCELISHTILMELGGKMLDLKKHTTTMSKYSPPPSTPRYSSCLMCLNTVRREPISPENAICVRDAVNLVVHL